MKTEEKVHSTTECDYCSNQFDESDLTDVGDNGETEWICKDCHNTIKAITERRIKIANGKDVDVADEEFVDDLILSGHFSSI